MLRGEGNGEGNDEYEVVFFPKLGRLGGSWMKETLAVYQLALTLEIKLLVTLPAKWVYLGISEH